MIPAGRIACSTLAFNGRSLSDALQGIRDLGFAAADLGAFESDGFGHLNPAKAADDLAATADALAAAAAAAGVRFAAFNTGWAAGDRLRDERIATALCLIAHRLSVPVVTVPAGPAPAAAAADRLRPLVELGNRYRVVVSAEVHRYNVSETPEGAAELIGLVPGLTLTFDPSHPLILGQRLADWTSLLSRVSHVHVRDAGPGGDWPKVQVPWGTGALDAVDLLRRLTGAGYTGAVSIEYLDPASLGQPPYDHLESIRAAKVAVEAALA